MAWCPVCEQEVIATVFCYDGARRCVMCRIEEGFDDNGNPVDDPEDYAAETDTEEAVTDNED